MNRTEVGNLKGTRKEIAMKKSAQGPIRGRKTAIVSDGSRAMKRAPSTNDKPSLNALEEFEKIKQEIMELDASLSELNSKIGLSKANARATGDWSRVANLEDIRHKTKKRKICLQTELNLIKPAAKKIKMRQADETDYRSVALSEQTKLLREIVELLREMVNRTGGHKKGKQG